MFKNWDDKTSFGRGFIIFKVVLTTYALIMISINATIQLQEWIFILSGNRILVFPDGVNMLNQVIYNEPTGVGYRMNDFFSSLTMFGWIMLIFTIALIVFSINYANKYRMNNTRSRNISRRNVPARRSSRGRQSNNSGVMLFGLLTLIALIVLFLAFGMY